jgi:polynucleotide 5'-kinase involved in rRNA processing
MSKDDIILMADASGLSYYGMGKDRDKFVHYLAAFAKLVAEAEREASAKLCEERGMVKGGEVFAARIRAKGNT